MNKSIGDGIIDFLSEVGGIEKEFEDTVKILERESTAKIEALKKQYIHIEGYKKFLMEYLEYIKPKIDERGTIKGLVIPEGFDGQIIHFRVSVNNMQPKYDGNYTTYRFNDDMECSEGDRSFITARRGARYLNIETPVKILPECCMRSGKYLIAAPEYVDASMSNNISVTRNDKHEMILNIHRLVPSPRIGSIYKGYSWTFPIDKDDFDLFVTEKYESFSKRIKQEQTRGHYH